MRNFRYIIALMTVAFLTLIAFQWYWIENAISVKREQFDRKVQEALSQTVKKIEKQEVIFLAKKRLKEQENRTLASLAEQPKTKTVVKKVRRKVPKKKEPPQEDFRQALASNVRRGLYAFDSSASDKVRVRDVAGLQGFEMPAGNVDFHAGEERRMPDNRLQFFKEMMREQNRMMQQFGQRAGDLMAQDREIQEIFEMLDNELAFVAGPNGTLVIPGEDLIGGNVTIQLNVQSVEPPQNIRPHFSYGDSLPYRPEAPLVRGFSKVIPSQQPVARAFRSKDSVKNVRQNEVAKARNVSKRPPKPKQEEEYEWVEVEEEVPVEEVNKQNKVALIKDVFTDFMQGERNIYDRLNREMVDTLLAQELKSQGVGIPFEYGVKDKSNIVFASYGLNSDPGLIGKAYNVRLFPNDSQIHNQWLYVYFPEKDNFILSNMWTVFGSSIFLILMIGGIFYTSVRTMLRQKKLSIIKNDFINNMTHEFKTPISTISLAVEVLKDRSISRDPEKYLNIIRDENKRLGSQVEKVLQMAVLDKGEMNLNFKTVNLHEVIEQLSQNLGVQIENKGGHLSLDLEAENANIEADEVHLTNIVYNLIDNAIKYTPEDPCIEIATRNIASGVELSVSDNGRGMSKEQLNHIFEKFYRVSTGNVHDVKGFGLGLSYVKKMVYLHRGEIDVRSRLGEGTTFVLRFNHEQNG
ncbi:HAMP domain-containing histidine kinase [Marinilongibacter aquaticus]|uniref:sensor histidine kinase n=1 Tax=Marinilongibacter aquaticus TaxID=2975157 RepID=UPI0021BD3D21|nr:HAMP domain-containing sensor histidine kinase [Marinilongibacter aquaticus]UBM57595.1 HAMP domain-containing histidine kinase [Marinilongibacter aquaticus]